MVTCDICGKELKTTQGLRGHKNFVHPDSNGNKTESSLDQAIQALLSDNSSTPVATDQPVRRLENRLQRATGPVESDQDLPLGDTEPVTEKLSGLTEQVTKLSDNFSQLSYEVKRNKRIEELKSKEVHAQLIVIQEAQNRQDSLVKKSLDTVNENYNAVKKLVEDLDKGLDTIRTKLTAHGHDGLSLIPQLSSGLKQVVQQRAGLQAEIVRAKVLAVRRPTGDFKTLDYTNGSKRTFRVYRGKMGLSKPHRVTIDSALGNKYVDLAEPID